MNSNLLTSLQDGLMYRSDSSNIQRKQVKALLLHLFSAFLAAYIPIQTLTLHCFGVPCSDAHVLSYG